MNKIYLSALIVPISATVCMAAAPMPAISPEPLPEGVGVSPEQGFIDISNSMYPLGVSSLGFSFNGQEIAVNTENTEPAKLYYNDFTTPAETTLATSVDPQTYRTGGVLFKQRRWTLNGQYKVEIPDGMFVYADGEDADGFPTGTAPTPGMTLYYEIYNGYMVLPGSGTVESLSGATISFPDADEVTANEQASTMQFYMDNSGDTYGCSYEICDAEGDGRKNDVRLTFTWQGSTEITAPGIYGLNVPAGAFTYKIYGDSHDADSGDYVEYNTNEILVKYSIPFAARPEIDPDPNAKVKEFTDFLLYIPAELDLWFADTMSQSPLYKVDEKTGIVDDTRMYFYAKPEPGEWKEEGFVTLGIYDPLTHERLEVYEPVEDGLYCLRLAPQLLFGSWNLGGSAPELQGSALYDYFYTVVTGTQGVTCPGMDADEERSKAVYNINGVKVADSVEELRNLPEGLYISGARKILNCKK